MNDPRMIISVDPGGGTGLARWIHPVWLREHYRLGGSSTDAEWYRTEIGPCSEDEQLKHLLTMLSGLTMPAQPFPSSGQPIHLIVEPFEFRQDDRNRDKIDYIAGEVIGAIRVWAYDRPYIRWIRQSASYGVEGFWTDDNVKKAALWVPGKRHAMDATKHILMYRSFKLDHIDLFELLK